MPQTPWLVEKTIFVRIANFHHQKWTVHKELHFRYWLRILPIHPNRIGGNITNLRHLLILSIIVPGDLVDVRHLNQLLFVWPFKIPTSRLRLLYRLIPFWKLVQTNLGSVVIWWTVGDLLSSEPLPPLDQRPVFCIILSGTGVTSSPTLPIWKKD